MSQAFACNQSHYLSSSQHYLWFIFVNMQLNDFNVILLRNILINLNVLRCRHIYLGQQGAHYGLQRLLPRAVIETDS